MIFSALIVLAETVFIYRLQLAVATLGGIALVIVSQRVRARFALALLFVGIVSYCLWLPIVSDDPEVQEYRLNSALVEIIPGKSTRGDVLLRFGRPDKRSDNILLYFTVHRVDKRERAARVIGFETDAAGRVVTTVDIRVTEHTHGNEFLSSWNFDYIVHLETIADGIRLARDAKVPNSLIAAQGIAAVPLLDAVAASMKESPLKPMDFGIGWLADVFRSSENGDWKQYKGTSFQPIQAVVSRDGPAWQWVRRTDVLVSPGSSEIRMTRGDTKEEYYLTCKFEDGFD